MTQDDVVLEEELAKERHELIPKGEVLIDDNPKEKVTILNLIPNDNLAYQKTLATLEKEQPLYLVLHGMTSPNDFVFRFHSHRKAKEPNAKLLSTIAYQEKRLREEGKL